MTLNIDAMMTTYDIDRKFLPEKIDVMVRGNTSAVREIIKKKWRFDNDYDDIGVVEIENVRTFDPSWMPDEDIYEDELMTAFYQLMRFMNEYQLNYICIN